MNGLFQWKKIFRVYGCFKQKSAAKIYRTFLNGYLLHQQIKIAVAAQDIQRNGGRFAFQHFA